MNKILCLAVLILITAIAIAACGSGPRRTATQKVPRVAPRGVMIRDSTLLASDDFKSVDKMAEMVYMKRADYPWDCKVAQIEGESYIKALVSRDGSVREVLLYKTSGSDLLDRSALKAAKDCKFKPAMKDGEPVDLWVVFSYVFVVEEH